MVIIEVEKIGLPQWRTKEGDEKRYRKLVSIMKQYGQLRNITVRKKPEELWKDGVEYEVLEGRNILKAATEIGLPFVWANDLGWVDDVTAMEVSLQLNELEFQTDFVDVAEIVQKIVECSNVRKATSLSMFDQKEVQKFLRIFKFDWEDFNRAKTSGQISLFETSLKTEENGLEESNSAGNNEQPEQSNSELSAISGSFGFPD